jgi:hypothetical protein
MFMKPKRMRAVPVAQVRDSLGTRNDRLAAAFPFRREDADRVSGDGDHAQDHKQEHDEGDADQYLHTGHRRTGEATETEQAGDRGDDKKN